jgi:hypothetical protein
MRPHVQTILLALTASGLMAGTALAANIPVPAEKCNAAWAMASPNGDAISKDANVPFVLNFTMLDSNKDAAIDAAEFNKACSSGKVQADEATVHNMKSVR